MQTTNHQPLTSKPTSPILATKARKQSHNLSNLRKIKTISFHNLTGQSTRKKNNRFSKNKQKLYLTFIADNSCVQEHLMPLLIRFPINQTP